MHHLEVVIVKVYLVVIIEVEIEVDLVEIEVDLVEIEVDLVEIEVEVGVIIAANLRLMRMMMIWMTLMRRNYLRHF